MLFMLIHLEILTYKFFEDKKMIEFINKNKEYSQEPIVRFFQQDYNKPFKELDEEFDFVRTNVKNFINDYEPHKIKSILAAWKTKYRSRN